MPGLNYLAWFTEYYIRERPAGQWPVELLFKKNGVRHRH